MIIQFLIFKYLVVQLRSIEKICSLQIFYTGWFRRSHAEVFLWVGVLKIHSKFIGEHSCRSAVSIKLLCNFTEITLWHGCYPVNLLHIFRTPFLKNTFGRMLLMLRNNFTVTAVGIFQTALGRYLTKFVLTIFLFHTSFLENALEFRWYAAQYLL